MDLRHMEAFLAVAEELSFTRAAQGLHQVQSGVSATVRALERDLGADLFVRSSRSVELSEAGAAFLPAAQDALAAAQAARDAVAGVTGKLGGTVRIAIATAIDMVDFPRLLGKFHQAHPGVTLTVISTTRGNDGVMAAIAEREIDLGLLTPTTWPSTVAVHEIARAPASVVLPAGQPCAGEPASAWLSWPARTLWICPRVTGAALSTTPRSLPRPFDAGSPSRWSICAVPASTSGRAWG